MTSTPRRGARAHSRGRCPRARPSLWVWVLLSLTACGASERELSSRSSEDAGRLGDTPPSDVSTEGREPPTNRLDLGGQDMLSGEAFRFPEELDVSLGLFDAVELKTRILAPRGFSLSFNQGPSLVLDQAYPMTSTLDPLSGKVWTGSDEAGVVAASARPVNEGTVRFEVLEWETGGRVEGLIEGGRFSWQSETLEVDLRFSGRFEITLPEL